MQVLQDIGFGLTKELFRIGVVDVHAYIHASLICHSFDCLVC